MTLPIIIGKVQVDPVEVALEVVRDQVGVAAVVVVAPVEVQRSRFLDMRYLSLWLQRNRMYACA